MKSVTSPREARETRRLRSLSGESHSGDTRVHSGQDHGIRGDAMAMGGSNAWVMSRRMKVEK